MITSLEENRHVLKSGRGARAEEPDLRTHPTSAVMLAGLKAAIETHIAEESRVSELAYATNDQSRKHRRDSLVPLPPTLAGWPRQSQQARVRSTARRGGEGRTQLDRLIGRLDEGGRGEAGDEEQECGRGPGW